MDEKISLKALHIELAFGFVLSALVFFGVCSFTSVSPWLHISFDLCLLWYLVQTARRRHFATATLFGTLIIVDVACYLSGIAA